MARNLDDLRRPKKRSSSYNFAAEAKKQQDELIAAQKAEEQEKALKKASSKIIETKSRAGASKAEEARTNGNKIKAKQKNGAEQLPFQIGGNQEMEERQLTVEKKTDLEPSSETLSKAKIDVNSENHSLENTDEGKTSKHLSNFFEASNEELINFGTPEPEIFGTHHGLENKRVDESKVTALEPIKLDLAKPELSNEVDKKSGASNEGELPYLANLGFGKRLLGTSSNPERVIEDPKKIYGRKGKTGASSEEIKAHLKPYEATCTYSMPVNVKDGEYKTLHFTFPTDENLSDLELCEDTSNDITIPSYAVSGILQDRRLTLSSKIILVALLHGSKGRLGYYVKVKNDDMAFRAGGLDPANYRKMKKTLLLLGIIEELPLPSHFPSVIALNKTFFEENFKDKPLIPTRGF